jgi:hypothetical protein
MVQEYCVQQVRATEANALRRKAALKTPKQAEAYIREVKTKIRVCFGPLPMRTSLNAHIIGTLDREAYKFEKVIFESRPGQGLVITQIF